MARAIPCIDLAVPIPNNLRMRMLRLCAAELGKETRAKAIREFRKLPSDKPEDQGKEEQRWRRAEIIIVCDMLLTGFDAPIVQTMYLDKGLKNHALLQAIAWVSNHMHPRTVS